MDKINQINEPSIDINSSKESTSTMSPFYDLANNLRTQMALFQIRDYVGSI